MLCVSSAFAGYHFRACILEYILWNYDTAMADCACTRWILHGVILSLRDLRASSSESSGTLRVRIHLFRQVLRSELWEFLLRERPFAVGGLPEEEVARALLARGAYDEIDVGEFGVIQMFSYGILCRIFGALHFPDGADDLVASSVVQCEVQRERGHLFAFLFYFTDESRQLLRNAVFVSRVHKACLLLPEEVPFLHEVLLEHSHEHLDFFHVPFPVFGGEAPDGQYGDTGDLMAPVREGPEIGHCFPVAFPRVQRMLPGPASVAVRNDGAVQGGRSFFHCCVKCSGVPKEEVEERGDIGSPLHLFPHLRSCLRPSVNQGAYASGFLFISASTFSTGVHFVSAISSGSGLVS